jgi:L-amino acid N-acyltransferase YncA
MQNKLVLSPMQAKDSEEIHALHERASASSLYYRFMRNYQPSYGDAECITGDGQGLVIRTDEDVMIAYAYYVVESGRTSEAEFAILIEDTHQGQGLGSYLISQLCQYAQSQGIERLKASIHGANNVMKHIIHRLDYTVQSSWEYGEFIIAIDLSAKIQDIRVIREQG